MRPCRADSDLKKWHLRLGHVNIHTLKAMARQATITGLSISPTSDIRVCGGCAHGKQHRVPFPVNVERSRVRHSGLFFHTDICGPMQVSSQGGARYFAVFKDDYSSYRFVFILKQRSEIYDVFKKLYQLSLTQTGHHITKLRSNNAKEYLSSRFQAFIDEKGIRHETSTYSLLP